MSKRNALYQCMRFAWQQGCHFSVWSGEEEGLCYYKGRDFKEAYRNTKNEDSASIHVLKDDEREWIYTVMGNDPEEAISDCTAYGFIDAWTELSNFGQQDVDPIALSWEQGRAAFHKKMEEFNAYS